MRPRRLRVHIVGRDRRDAATVIDAGANERGEFAGAQVGRRLDVHLRFEKETRDSDRPQMIVERGRLGAGHARARLRPKVLNDDFLDMAVRVVEIAQREQRLDPLGAGLADADQDARGEGNSLLAGAPDRVESRLGMLVRRTVMRTAFGAETKRQGLQHDPLRDRDGAQGVEIVIRHQSRIDVRQEARLLQDQTSYFCEIGERGFVAEFAQFRPGDAVAQFRLVPEREQSLLASGLPASLCDGEGPLRKQIRAFALPGRAGEGAIVADVTAELRERDEDLA